jgi:ornithine cyclodeaminase/alanine dehydrogenase-like protein (mu-crystallin family)
MALILSDADVKALNPPMRGAVEVIEECCRLQASGDLTNHPRVHLAYPPSGVSAKRQGFGNRTLRILPAIVPALDATGFRVYTIGPRKSSEASALLILFSFEDMTLKAIINDSWLHYIRTGAPAGVAAKYLARGQIDTVGVIGSGRIARRAVEAVACVRKFRRIKVYSPNEERRLAYARAMRGLLGVEVEPQEDSRSAIQGADILITATNAYCPVYDGSWLAPGTLVISLAPGEIDVTTLERGKIFATWKDQALHDIPPREPFKTLAAEGRLAEFETKCRELHDAVTGASPGRESEDEIITCLVPASSIWDPAMASWAYGLARAKGIGTDVVI